MSANISDAELINLIAPPISSLPPWSTVCFIAGGLVIGATLAYWLSQKTSHKRPYTKKGDKKRYYTREQWYVNRMVAWMKRRVKIILRGAV